jgi:hypothetical protein
MNFSKRKKDLIFLAIAPILGLASFILPVVLTERIKIWNSDYSILKKVVGPDGFTGFTALCLIISGITLGFLNPKRPWLWGLLTMSLFPVIAIIEMSGNPYSHNIWPIEFVMYAILSFPAIIGAFIGVFMKKNGVRNAFKIIFKFLFK